MKVRRAENKDIEKILDLLIQVDMVHHNGRPDIFKGPVTKYDAEQLEDIIKEIIEASVDYEKCKKCGACSRIMCPALVAGPDKKPVIDPEACNACGLCINMCKFNALSKKEEA